MHVFNWPRPSRIPRVFARTTRIEVKQLIRSPALPYWPGAGLRSIPVIKTPSMCWGRKHSQRVDEARVRTVLELSWTTESIEDLERKLFLWSNSGRNTLSVKLWWKGQEGDAAALGEVVPGQNEWCRHGSILFITQGARDSYKRVWRIGHPAQVVRLSDPQHTIEMGAYTGVAGAIKVHWTVLTQSSPTGLRGATRGPSKGMVRGQNQERRDGRQLSHLAGKSCGGEPNDSASSALRVFCPAVKGLLTERAVLTVFRPMRTGRKLAYTLRSSPEIAIGAVYGLQQTCLKCSRDCNVRCSFSASPTQEFSVWRALTRETNGDSDWSSGINRFWSDPPMFSFEAVLALTWFCAGRVS